MRFITCTTLTLSNSRSLAIMEEKKDGTVGTHFVKTYVIEATTMPKTIVEPMANQRGQALGLGLSS